ncbi:MAG: dienelactone hydrolase family protein [Candidatus Omnitrophota bacterium]
MRYLFFTICIFLSASNVFAAIHTETVEYKQGDVLLEGYLAYDDALAGKRPGVLVVHEWKGIVPYTKTRAEKLASLGFVAFAADIYGKGIRPQSNEEAAQQAGIYKNDRSLMRERAKAGLNVLQNHALVDPKRVAAIGYCFGGTTVLELARSGANLKGVVSFHGGLGTPNPTDIKNFKGKILVLHGADDPFVSLMEVLAFQDEMQKGKADWQFISYGNTVHSFTNPDAGTDSSKGAAYNKLSDERSWEVMKQFFAEIFK